MKVSSKKEEQKEGFLKPAEWNKGSEKGEVYF